jgi:hypothetical protein
LRRRLGPAVLRPRTSGHRQPPGLRFVHPDAGGERNTWAVRPYWAPRPGNRKIKRECAVISGRTRGLANRILGAIPRPVRIYGFPFEERVITGGPPAGKIARQANSRHSPGARAGRGFCGKRRALLSMHSHRYSVVIGKRPAYRRLRRRVAGPGAPGMSDPGLHDRAAGGRLARPARAISLVLIPVI